MQVIEKPRRCGSVFQLQTAMDIKHHQNRVALLNTLDSLDDHQRELLKESLDILADPHTGYGSSKPHCQCGCRDIEL